MAKQASIRAASAQARLDTMRSTSQVERRTLHSTKPHLISSLRPELLFERHGVRENPFGVTPDPHYLYPSRTHAEAKSSLIVGIECGIGFQALIAPPGMGKTTILFDVLERFDNVARTAFLFQIQGDSCDFLRYLLSELGGEGHTSDLVHIQDAINQLLIKERRTGRRTIVIIDEAQSLDASVLETVRLLSNFETPTEKLLQIVLAGQPQLAQQLGRPELTQLHQRISILRTLTPFDLEDTKNYVEHRLKIAGYQGQPLFTSTALRSIWESSRGVPREINTICFNALLLATAVGEKQVDSDILQEVIADLEPVGILSRSPNDTFREAAAGKRPSNAFTKSPARIESAYAAPSTTYQHFYNFVRSPFDASLDLSFMCFTSNHREALAASYAGILGHQGLILLTGEPGTGKSLVVLCLMELLKRGHVPVEYILGQNCSSSELLTVVARDVGSISSYDQTDHTKGGLRTDLKPHFPLPSEQSIAVLLVDEAQDLSTDALQKIQLLTSLQSAGHSVLQVVLVGRPEIDQRLNSPEFWALKQRVAVHHCIKPLDEAEANKYIACRVRIAKINWQVGSLFCEDALAAIYRYSRGIPRLINRLCQSALISGYARQQKNITRDIIEEIAQRCCTDASLEERTWQSNTSDAGEIIEAARILLEFHTSLHQMRSGTEVQAPVSKLRHM